MDSDDSSSYSTFLCSRAEFLPVLVLDGGRGRCPLDSDPSFGSLLLRPQTENPIRFSCGCLILQHYAYSAFLRGLKTLNAQADAAAYLLFHGFVLSLTLKVPSVPYKSRSSYPNRVP